MKPRQGVAYWNPAGLRIDHSVLNPKKPDDKFANGIFVIDKNLKPSIISKDDLGKMPDVVVAARYVFAIQAGPILVNKGQVVPNVDPGNAMGITPRAMIGITATGEILLARISGEVSLEEAADFMLKQGAREALNLQGDSAAIFWFNGETSQSFNRQSPNLCEAIVVE